MAKNNIKNLLDLLADALEESETKGAKSKEDKADKIQEKLERLFEELDENIENLDVAAFDITVAKLRKQLVKMARIYK